MSAVDKPPNTRGRIREILERTGDPRVREELFKTSRDEHERHKRERSRSRGKGKKGRKPHR